MSARVIQRISAEHVVCFCLTPEQSDIRWKWKTAGINIQKWNAPFGEQRILWLPWVSRCFFIPPVFRSSAWMWDSFPMTLTANALFVGKLSMRWCWNWQFSPVPQPAGVCMTNRPSRNIKRKKWSMSHLSLRCDPIANCQRLGKKPLISTVFQVYLILALLELDIFGHK